MNFKKIVKVISAIVALAALAAAAYFAVQKLLGTKEPEYFDDNDFFECDNEIEIVEAKKEDAVVEEAPAEEAPKEATKRLLPRKQQKRQTLNNFL